MEKISNTFDIIIGELGLEKYVPVENLRKGWNKLFGDPIRRHASPSSYGNGVLTINVDSPEWLHELQYHRETMLAKLSPFGLDTIRFKLGPVRRWRIPETSPEQKKKRITPEEIEYIENTASPIKDASLRERIKKAMEFSIAFGGKYHD